MNDTTEEKKMHVCSFSLCSTRCKSEIKHKLLAAVKHQSVRLLGGGGEGQDGDWLAAAKHKGEQVV